MLSSRDRRRRRLALVFWRAFNPLARSLAGIAPWWVVLETRGRRSGLARRVPLAKGPVDVRLVWLISVHGEHSSFVRNIAAEERVRLKMARRWQDGTASVEPVDRAVLDRFSGYARMGPRTFGIEPKLIRVELD